MALSSPNSAFSQVTALARCDRSTLPLHGCTATQDDHGFAGGGGGHSGAAFGEQARAEWLAARFANAGLSNVETDAAGTSSVAAGRQIAAREHRPGGRALAHLDTVFPAETPLNPKMNGDRIEAPGACDNCAGVRECWLSPTR